jgi:2-dehydro-3-deoxyphosphogluconate aldolase/(4S)-4-hydroxy-2-oxoglutarate aldolase
VSDSQGVVEMFRGEAIIPVLVIVQVTDAVPIVEPLVCGRLRWLEVILRTPIGLEAMSAIRRGVRGALVGAGSVIEPQQFSQIKAAGALFGDLAWLDTRNPTGLVYTGPGLGSQTPLSCRESHGRQYGLFGSARSPDGRRKCDGSLQFSPRAAVQSTAVQPAEAAPCTMMTLGASIGHHE